MTAAIKQDYAPGELERCHEFIEKTGVIEKPNKPIHVLATEVLLNVFRWPSDSPSSQGYKRAKAILLALEAQGKVECDWSPGKRLLGIRLKKPSTPSSSEEQQVEKLEPLETPTSPNKLELDRNNRARHLAAIHNHKSKGRARRKIEIARRGERHENWLHASILQLIEALTREFPEIVLNGGCPRSGRHNPKKGKVDLADHYGNDVAPWLTTRLSTGQLQTGYIIYDGKGAESAVKRFNGRVFLRPGQKGALKKKAIWANQKFRSTKNLLEEILNDFIDVGLLPAEFDKKKALNFFED